MLRAVRVDHLEALLQVVDEHDRGLLAAQRGRHAAAVHAWRPPGRSSLASTAPASSTDGVTRTAAASGSCSAWETRSAATCVGVRRAVGQDRDLGRSRLGVDADDPADQPLGRGDVDVAGAGDDVDRLAERLAVHVVGAGRAVGEHRDRLRAADGVHLVDAEQRARGQHHRVGQAALVLLRRGRHGERADAGRLRGDDVHDDRRRVDREPARDVEADAADRDPPLADLRAGRRARP